MSVRFASSIPRDAAAPAALRCAFVNNMPDSAFDATERQFVDLLDVASRDRCVEVFRYAMDTVPRGEVTAERIAQDYAPFRDLYARAPDILIVTGSNPIEVEIRDEPYWSDLVELLMWSRDEVKSTLLSCLSAHATLEVFDDVRRVRLGAKCTGVFPQSVDGGHRLAKGFDTETVLPHSRWNAVPTELVERAGYEVVVGSPETGWGVAVKEREERSLLLVQGHPEYDPSSLLREYRRDAGRYARGERDDLPCLPFRCANDEDWPRLMDLHRTVCEVDRDPRRVDEFPFDEVGARAPWPWRENATRLYANWLSSVGAGED